MSQSRQIEPKGTPLAECMRDYFERHLSLDDTRRDDQEYLDERQKRIHFLVRDFSRPTSIPMRHRMTEKKLLFRLQRGIICHPNHVFLFGVFLTIENYNVLEMQSLSAEVYDLADLVFGRKASLQEVAKSLRLEIFELVKILNGQLSVCHALSRDIITLIDKVEKEYESREEEDQTDEEELADGYDYLGNGYPDDFDPEEIHGLDRENF